jgi:hypothetical protein
MLWKKGGMLQKQVQYVESEMLNVVQQAENVSSAARNIVEQAEHIVL